MRTSLRSRGAGMFALAAAMVLSSAAPRAARVFANTRTIFASINDKAGLPPKDISPADITVREDGQSREVVSVKPAATPMTVALLIDNSHVTQAMTQDLRLGMTSFVTTLLKLSPDSTMSLMTFGDRPTAVRDFTSSVPVLTKDTGRLFPVSGSGSYLLDALMDTTKALKKVDSPRKVIVAFTDESGEEFSNAGRQQVFDAVQASGAAVWIVVLQGGGPAVETPEGRDRSAVIGDLPRQSGGSTITILNKMALKDKMTHVASLLANEFEITYGRPDQLIPPSKLEVTIANKDLTIVAPRWTGK